MHNHVAAVPGNRIFDHGTSKHGCLLQGFSYYLLRYIVVRHGQHLAFIEVKHLVDVLLKQKLTQACFMPKGTQKIGYVASLPIPMLLGC